MNGVGGRKKICLIATVPITVESFMLATAKRLSETMDVSIICDEDEDLAKKLPENIKYIPIKMSRGISLSGVSAFFRMWNVFRVERFDCLFYTTPNASMYASLAGLLAGIHVRVYSQGGLVYESFLGVKRTVFRLIEKLTCYFSSYVLPVSNGIMSLCRSEGFYDERKSRVVWNGSVCGIDLCRFDSSKRDEYRIEIREKHGIDKTSFVVGFLGRITRDKGINELISSFKRFSTDKSDVSLMLVGGGEQVECLNADLWEWAKKTDSVCITGSTQSPEKYYTAMDLFVLPSYREGFGMAVAEAEAMGTPVVVTDIKGPVEAMRNYETGRIVPVKNTDALIDIFEELYADRETLLRYGEAGVRFVKERFDSEIHFEKTLDFINKLLEDNEIKGKTRRG